MTSPQPGPLDLANPLAGRWTVRHSPADRVPSHGTELFASALAVDLVPVDDAGRTGRITWRTLVTPERPEHFTGFGRPVLAPVSGTVLAAVDEHPDHAAHRGLPSIAYALGQQRRAAGGWPALAGNHVRLASEDGPVVALCHLRRGSLRVVAGQKVRRGEQVAECGNSGNSTEPHLHVQAMTSPDPTTARPVEITIHGRMPHNGEVVEPGTPSRP
ncbi:M23 family metallopeptidase [Kytococcus sedentarius]|uniref:M23 family metallopeptidase n=1 Tax=Kytococcus sedentarius TaxID=1276 RepID=UPI0035BBA699